MALDRHAASAARDDVEEFAAMRRRPISLDITNENPACCGKRLRNGNMDEE
jgi:hypothetical protein